MSTASKDNQQSILLLTNLQYAHIIDNNKGVVRLVEGPYRGPLESNESLYGNIRSKIIVKETQYTAVLNPFDVHKKEVRYGDREIRVGPTIFSLYPGEELEKGEVHDEIVLEQDKGILIKALRDYDDKGKARKAGDLWIITGPTTYIPNKFASIERFVSALSLGRDDGIYIKNIRTGQISIELGPKTIMLSPEEELFNKDYRDSEIKALKITLETFDFSKAIPLQLLKQEAMMILSGEKHRVEFGPKTILLDPFERPYVMDISGSTPKKPNVLKIWKALLGPVFSTDELGVRTKDNASLKIQLRYKWRFRIDVQHPEKIFAVEDFIGFGTETMAGIIREEAAKYNFEEFHAKAAEIIKNTVFSHSPVKLENPTDPSYIFQENGFEIFGIDIKKIAPEDPEIATQLNNAIKSNMDVYVKKIQQTAQLDAERQLVEGKIQIEKTKGNLITLEQQNIRAEKLGAAKIEAEAATEVAKGQADAIKIREFAKAEAEANKISKTIEALKAAGSDQYLKLQQIGTFNNVDKTLIVPTDSKLFIPMADLLEGTKQKKLES